MRIGLDIRYTTDHFPGIGRYVVSLARALAELDHGHTLVLIHDPRARGGRYGSSELSRLPRVELAPLAMGAFSPLQQLALPRLAQRLKLDLLHSPYFIKPYGRLPCPSVVTIYDLIGWRYPRTLSRRGRLLYRLTMSMAVRSAAAVIAISQSARDEIAQVYRLPVERLAVTPLGVERRFQPQPTEAIEALRARHNLPERYVLYLGSNKPHKNLERLVQAWQRVIEEGAAGDALLVLAGHEDRQHPELRQFVAARGLEARVRFLPSVTDAELPALYSGATVFAFPSYYEGFGLPPLEAMACGTAVLCAYASSLPEVAGGAALTVDPFSFVEIAAGLTRLLHDPSLRQSLSARGQQRAREYSWRRTALGTLRVYERVAR